MADLPRYQCTKIVQAAPIVTLWRTPEGWGVSLDLGGGRTFTRTVPIDTFARFQPSAGDYLVVYADGYTSASPHGVFEAGYEPIAEPVLYG